MKEYILSDGTAVMIKSYEEWLYDRIHMMENEFLAKLEKNYAYFHYKQEQPEEVIRFYRNEYSRYVDRIHLDHISLTYSEYLKAYEGHTPASFDDMCDATGATHAEKMKWLEWIREKWEKHENNIIPF